MTSIATGPKNHTVGITVRAIIVLALFGVACLPGYAYARVQGTKFVPAPESIIIKNSQTMTLLEGSHNASQSVGAIATLAIVDDNALVSESVSSEVSIESDKQSGQISVYVVREDDTLATIAKMFGVSANTIVWANNTSGLKIIEGQELVILPVSGVRHAVKSGDTVKSIVAKYKGDLDDVLAYNGLTVDSKLSLGEEVIIPDGELTTTTKSASVASKSSGGKTSSNFVKPAPNGRRSQGIHGHNGIDLAGPVGSSIVAAAKGTVIVSNSGGYNGGYGNYIVIKHGNGTQTLYSHLSANYVSVGDAVSQGQKIGAMGNTGKSTGSHLHFEVRGGKNPF